jgi:hypothetical protein
LVTAAQEIATPKTFRQSLKWVFFRTPYTGCDFFRGVTAKNNLGQRGSMMAAKAAEEPDA